MDEFPDFLGKSRLSIGGHAHDLVLAFVHFEPQKRREGAVKKANRMRKLHLLYELDIIAPSHARAGGHPVAHAIDRKNGRLLERRAKKSTRRMGKMVLGKQNSFSRNSKLCL